MPRDMSRAEFEAACKRAGFVKEGFMGYYRLPGAPNTCVSAWNGGSRLRDQLAYLHRENDRYSASDKGKD